MTRPVNKSFIIIIFIITANIRPEVSCKQVMWGEPPSLPLTLPFSSSLSLPTPSSPFPALPSSLLSPTSPSLRSRPLNPARGLGERCITWCHRKHPLFISCVTSGKLNQFE